ncbi:MAG: hypothetical protein Q8Q48_01375 [Candidatus Staskawiczbacteria bacterium]|nr:hypothetical protein [Candidatus Staskawiczbacteria bacterium]
MKKNILFLVIISVILFSLLAAPIFATNTTATNENLIQMLQQKIADLIKQITDLIKQLTQQQTAQISESLMQQNYQPAENSVQTSTASTTNTNVQSFTNNSAPNSGQATLTVNVTGATAYVSINGGSQFAYSGPIKLNNGDKYSVIVSSSTSSNGNTSSSKTTCSGTASSGGTYYCNINVQ